MPKEDNAALKPPAVDSAVDDADEVVDLLEVVKPGKVIAADAEDVDFSADLESMLDTLSRAEQSQAEPQPFPDPTPVEHEVDHDESLDLPGMDDLDSILSSLSPGDAGAAKQVAESAPAPGDAAAAARKAGGSDSAAPQSAARSPIDMPDLDALPATSLPGGPAAPGESAASAADQKAVDIDDDFLESLLAGGAEGAAPQPAPDQAAKAAADDPFDALQAAAEEAPPAPAPGEPAVDDDDNGLAASLETAVGDIASESIDMAADPAAAEPEGEAPPVSQKKPAPEAEQGEAGAPVQEDPPADAAAGSRFEEVDLNELDALLDDMLAAAPASGPASAAGAALPASERPAQGQPGAAFASEPGLAVPAEALAGIQSMAADLAALRDEMEALRHAVDDAPATGDLQATVTSQAATLAAQAARLEDIELTLAARAGEEQSAAAQVQALEGALAKTEGRLAALEEQLSHMNANLDKMAAEAAARVIREEIAALMAEGEG